MENLLENDLNLLDISWILVSQKQSRPCQGLTGQELCHIAQPLKHDSRNGAFLIRANTETLTLHFFMIQMITVEA